MFLAACVRRPWSPWIKLDGAVYASPIAVGGVIVVATENDSVYAGQLGAEQRGRRRARLAGSGLVGTKWVYLPCTDGVLVLVPTLAGVAFVRTS